MPGLPKSGLALALKQHDFLSWLYEELFAPLASILFVFCD